MFSSRNKTSIWKTYLDKATSDEVKLGDITRLANGQNCAMLEFGDPIVKEKEISNKFKAAEKLMKGKKVLAAQDAFIEILMVDPGHLLSMHQLAKILLAIKPQPKIQDAEISSKIKSFDSINVNSPIALWSYAENLKWMDQISMSELYYKGSLCWHLKLTSNSSPSDISIAYYEFGRFLEIVKGNWMAAEGLYKNSILKDEKNVSATYRLGVLMNDRRANAVESERLLAIATDIAFESDPLYADILVHYAYIRTTFHKDFDSAKGLLEKAISVKSDCLPALIQLGLLYATQKKDHVSALGYWSQVLEKEPNHVQALCYMARAHHNLGDHDSAEKKYAVALKNVPDSAELLFQFATFQYNVRKDLDRAERLLRQALKADAVHQKSMFLLGKILMQKNDIEGPGFLRKLLELNPRHFEALAYMGTKSASTFATDEGERYFLRAIQALGDKERSPEAAPVYHAYGGFLWKARENPVKAEEYFQKAIAANPKFVPSLYKLGCIYSEVKERKDLASAESFFRQAHEIDPTYTPAQAKLHELKPNEFDAPANAKTVDDADSVVASDSVSTSAQSAASGSTSRSSASVAAPAPVGKQTKFATNQTLTHSMMADFR